MKEGDFVNSLIKVANDMVDVTEQKSSPEEVLAALQSIISELESVAQSIPAEDAAPKEAVPQEDDSGIKAELAQLKEKVARREREDLAVQYASLFEDSLKSAKTDEVIKSDKDNGYWLAKIESIAEYTKTTPQSRQAQSFSYQKVAKQDSGLWIL